jgi:hypothetical protein
MSLSKSKCMVLKQLFTIFEAHCSIYDASIVKVHRKPWYR